VQKIAMRDEHLSRVLITREECFYTVPDAISQPNPVALCCGFSYFYPSLAKGRTKTCRAIHVEYIRSVQRQWAFAFIAPPGGLH